MATINYVKFLRGTPTAYANLATKDPNTLYFISATGATTGKLYLGDKEISGGSSSGGTGATTLAELTDIVLSTVQDKQILIYDSTTSKWKNGFVSDIIDSILDSNVLVKNASGQLTLEGYASASSGAVAQKGSDGKLKWVALTDSYSKSEIDSMLAGRLKRKKVDSVSAIDVSASDAELYIYLVPAATTATNNVYDEYIVVDGVVEMLNQAPVDLTGYVTSDSLTTTLADYVTSTSLATTLDSYVTSSKYSSEVGAIGDLKSDLTSATIIGQVNALTTILEWNDMVES